MRPTEKMLGVVLMTVPVLILFAQQKCFLLGAPLYAPELLTGVALILFLAEKQSIFSFLPRRSVYSIALGILAIGLMASLFQHDITPHGAGRLKSWFFFPMLYGMLFSFALQRGILTIRNGLWGMYLGGIGVGLLAVFRILEGAAWTYDGRLRGDFPSPNHLAMLLGSALIAGIFFAREAWDKRKWSRIRNIFGSLFLLVLTLLTQSYETIFALGVVSLLIVIWYRRQMHPRIWAMAIFVPMVVVSGLFLLNEQKWEDAVSLGSRSSLASRSMIWHSSLQMIADHPLAGIGPGNFQEQYIAYQLYFPPYLEWSAPHPHNMFLDLWLEGGLISFFAFGVFFFFWLSSSIQNLWKKKKESAFFVLPFFFAGYFFLVGLVDVPFLRNDLAYFFITAFAISHFLLTRGGCDRSSRHDD